MSAIRKLYRKLLQRLCRIEMKAIADKYPIPRKELIQYHDFMAIYVLDSESEARDRILGVSVATAKALED